MSRDPDVVKQLLTLGFSTKRIDMVYSQFERRENERLQRSPNKNAYSAHRVIQILADQLAEGDCDDGLQQALANSIAQGQSTQAITIESGGSAPAERDISGNPLEGGSLATRDGNCKICREARCRTPAKCHMIEGLIDAVTFGAERTKIVEICQEAGRHGFRNLVNEPCKRDVEEGRTALAYAVQMNLYRMTSDLIELGASVHQRMGANTTALTLAATNKSRDGTEMVRLLLSKRADPSELKQAGIDNEKLNITMRYWLDISNKSPKLTDEDMQHLEKARPMNKKHELAYAIVGERLSLAMFKSALSGYFSKPRGFTSGKLEREPMVMLLLGCPGHGKTYLSRNAAKALVGEDNYKEVACGAIRDDADLFGSNPGGARRSSHSSKGELIEWLRERQGKDVIVFLDEFEKIQGGII
jgi:SpoVK/Ycf46/Vps4 family AAA+-type ATPase